MPEPSPPPHTVLFIGTGNTARSLMAEVALRRYAPRRFRALSAGTAPTGQVHSQTLRVLQILNYRIDTLYSKSLDRFVEPGGPSCDFVFTVCDAASRQTAPLWSRQSVVAHWPSPDPTHFVGSDDDALRVFRTVFLQLEMRIKAFVELSLDGLSYLDRQASVEIIGHPLPPIAVAE